MAGPNPFIKRLASRFGRKYGIKPSVLLGLIEVESGFQPGAVSSANAQGLTQFIPSTAASYGVKYGTGRKAQKTQIRGAARYLQDLGASKNLRLALAKYNAGPGNPSAAGNYPELVLAAARDYLGTNKGGLPPIKPVGGGRKGQIGNFDPTQDPSYQRISALMGLDPGARPGFEKSYALQQRGYELLQKLAYDKAVQSAPQRQKGFKFKPADFGASGGKGADIKPGGGYSGTKNIALGLAQGFELGSQKRPTKFTSSGNISDHWEGNKNAYAIDLPASGKQGDRIVKILARRLGVSPKQLVGTFDSINYKGFRVQVLWKVADHRDHVHLGVSAG